MASDKGQRELAPMLCNAVKEYVAHINKLAANAGEGSVSQNNAPVTTTPQSVPATVQNPAAKSVAEGYTIQVLASDKRVER